MYKQVGELFVNLRYWEDLSTTGIYIIETKFESTHFIL